VTQVILVIRGLATKRTSETGMCEDLREEVQKAVVDSKELVFPEGDSVERITNKENADLVESVAGAVFVDTGFDLEAATEVLKPLIMQTQVCSEINFMMRLHEHCSKYHKRLDIQVTAVKLERHEYNVRYEVSILIDEEVVCSDWAYQSKKAKHLAAEGALKILERRGATEEIGV